MTFNPVRRTSAFLLILIITCIAGLPGALAQESETPAFDRLKARFDAGEVFQAAYIHTFTDAYTGEELVSTGEIWIDHIGYKLDSDGQKVVVDGETSRVYDANRNRVIISEYDPETDDFAPSRMLNGVDSTYAVSEKKSGKGSIITLLSEDDFAVFTRVEIELDEMNRPLKITAYDISENVIETLFDKGRFRAKDNDIFSLDFPVDAEIVDMRY